MPKEIKDKEGKQLAVKLASLMASQGIASIGAALISELMGIDYEKALRLRYWLLSHDWRELDGDPQRIVPPAYARVKTPEIPIQNAALAVIAGSLAAVAIAMQEAKKNNLPLPEVDPNILSLAMRVATDPEMSFLGELKAPDAPLSMIARRELRDRLIDAYLLRAVRDGREPPAVITKAILSQLPPEPLDKAEVRAWIRAMREDIFTALFDEMTERIGKMIDDDLITELELALRARTREALKTGGDNIGDSINPKPQGTEKE